MDLAIKKPKMDISFDKEKTKGSKIEKAVAAVGGINTKICVDDKCLGKSGRTYKAENLLNRHGKEKIRIKMDY